MPVFLRNTAGGEEGRDTDTSRRFTKRAERAESIGARREREREADAVGDQYSAQAKSLDRVPMDDIYIFPPLSLSLYGVLSSS